MSASVVSSDTSNTKTATNTKRIKLGGKLVKNFIPLQIPTGVIGAG